jgi:hypothetical protein
MRTGDIHLYESGAARGFHMPFPFVPPRFGLPARLRNRQDE